MGLLNFSTAHIGEQANIHHHKAVIGKLRYDLGSIPRIEINFANIVDLSQFIDVVTNYLVVNDVSLGSLNESFLDPLFIRHSILLRTSSCRFLWDPEKWQHFLFFTLWKEQDECCQV